MCWTALIDFCPRSEGKNSGNSRNGKSTKTLKGEFGELDLDVPRDRQAHFEPMLVPKYETRFAEAINEQKLAKATSLFSGADLQALVEQAVERVIDEALTSDTEPPLTMRHLEETLAELHPSTLEWLRQARNYVEFANQDRKYDEVAKSLRTREARLLS